VTHPREELDLGAPRLLATFAGSFGVGPSACLADGDDDETRALLDQSHHPLARRARLAEHHHQLADGLSIEAEQRNELDAAEAERAGERAERLVAFQCVAHDDPTMLQQSDAEGVGAWRVRADQRDLVVVDAKRCRRNERPAVSSWCNSTVMSARASVSASSSAGRSSAAGSGHAGGTCVSSCIRPSQWVHCHPTTVYEG
jgi:hypothetical protein